MGNSDNLPSNQQVLFDFQMPSKLDGWLIVNDGVMGGLSKSKIFLSDRNTAIFQGIVSLENNGGFSSTRTTPRPFNIDGYNGILLRVKGDGKKYQFRLRTNDRFDGISYRYHFQTENNKWITVKVPFSECAPVFRGRILNDVDPVLLSQIQQLGFLISDKQAGPFKLEVEWIKAYR
jgi:monofunctional biosynthetic peptidoglycan transglycosylase